VVWGPGERNLRLLDLGSLPVEALLYHSQKERRISAYGRKTSCHHWVGAPGEAASGIGEQPDNDLVQPASKAEFYAHAFIGNSPVEHRHHKITATNLFKVAEPDLMRGIV